LAAHAAHTASEVGVQGVNGAEPAAQVVQVVQGDRPVAEKLVPLTQAEVATHVCEGKSQ